MGVNGEDDADEVEVRKRDSEFLMPASMTADLYISVESNKYPPHPPRISFADLNATYECRATKIVA